MSHPVRVGMLAFHTLPACSGYTAPSGFVSQIVKGLFAKLIGASIHDDLFIGNEEAFKPRTPIHQLERSGRADSKGSQAGAGAKLRVVNVQGYRSGVVNQIGLLTGELAAPIAFR